MLDFRPWPNFYRIKHPEFEFAECGFIAIRFKLKADVETPFKYDVQDLKKFIENFYEKLRGSASKGLTAMLKQEHEELLREH